MKIDLLEGFSHLTNVYFSTRKYLYLGLCKTKIYIDLIYRNVVSSKKWVFFSIKIKQLITLDIPLKYVIRKRESQNPVCLFFPLLCLWITWEGNHNILFDYLRVPFGVEVDRVCYHYDK